MVMIVRLVAVALVLIALAGAALVVVRVLVITRQVIVQLRMEVGMRELPKREVYA